MKYLILTLLLAVNAKAENVFKVPNDNSTTSYVKVGYSVDEGITVYYPESYKTKIGQRPSSSIYINESSCDNLLPLRVDDIQNIDSVPERERQIQSRLIDNDGLISVANYFPFYGQSFYKSIENHLKQNGISHIHYKYPTARPLFRKATYKLKPGSLTSKLGISNVQDYIKLSDDNVNSILYLQTKFLPLACDFLNKKLQVNIEWEISLMPHNNNWVETLSENQIYKIYSNMKSKQSLVPNTSVVGADAASFIQGALAGQAYESEAKKLNKDNVGNFAKLMTMLLDTRSQTLNELSTSDLEDVHLRMMEDQTTALEFQGVAHAK